MVNITAKIAQFAGIDSQKTVAGSFCTSKKVDKTASEVAREIVAKATNNTVATAKAHKGKLAIAGSVVALGTAGFFVATKTEMGQNTVAAAQKVMSDAAAKVMAMMPNIFGKAEKAEEVVPQSQPGMREQLDQFVASFVPELISNNIPAVVANNAPHGTTAVAAGISAGAAGFAMKKVVNFVASFMPAKVAADSNQE